MPRAREITMTFLVISPEAESLYSYNRFLDGFYKNLSFKIAMSRRVSGVGCKAVHNAVRHFLFFSKAGLIIQVFVLVLNEGTK